MLLPRRISPVSPGRGEAACIFEPVAFVPHYPPTLCTYPTALCTVFVTNISSSQFQLLTSPTWLHKTYSFPPRVCVCHWGRPCSAEYFADVSKKWKQPSEGYPHISSLSATPFSHHITCCICWEGCPKTERLFTEWKRVFFFIDKQ